MIRKQDALDYHSQGRRGKIEVVSSKPCATQRDLSLAYTPGVAEPCREIAANPDDAYLYTAKGNLVAVVSNGTAVLGLGDIGPLAGKPVMEGKGVLFKRFADIDVFDIELNSHNPDDIIKAVQMLEPTFGGINLEDIKAPECFYIEDRTEESDEHPGLSRRPARHGDHQRCGAHQRAGGCRKKNRQSESGLQRRRRGRDGLRAILRKTGSAAREHVSSSTRKAWCSKAERRG